MDAIFVVAAVAMIGGFAFLRKRASAAAAASAAAEDAAWSVRWDRKV